MTSRKTLAIVIVVSLVVACLATVSIFLATRGETPSSSLEPGTAEGEPSHAPSEQDGPSETGTSSGQSERGQPSSRRYTPPPTRDRDVARFVDRGAKDRVTPDITSRMPRLRHEEDIRAVAFVLRDATDDDTVRNEAANLLRRSSYAGLVDDLISVLENPDEGPRFRSFAVQHLWQAARGVSAEERSRISGRLREALEDRDIPVRREALLALVRLGDEAGKEAAVRWLLAEEAEGVRDAAIRCVRELDLREHAPAIRKFLRDEDEVVRIAAIVTLSQWGDEESREAFEDAARSNNVRLQRAGRAAIERLGAAARGE